MTSHSPQSTLSALATEHAGASRVFQRLGLDFCCKGRRSLQSACAERGLDPDAVLAEIEGSASPGAAPLESTEAIIRFVVTHYHPRVREELPRLREMAAKVERVHAARAGCPAGLGAHLERMAGELTLHMRKEEEVLFPLIASGGARLYGPVQVMEAEHRDHAANLSRLRELAHDFIPPPHACATWRALYLGLSEFERELMEHVHLENNVLFPRVLGGA